MTLDPTSQLFKDAIAITGWPECLRTQPLSAVRLPEVWQLRGPGSWCDEHRGYHYSWWSIDDDVAEALLEHHFRVWLEERHCNVSRIGRVMTAYIAKYWRRCNGEAVEVQLRESKTYLECQMKAVVKIGKAKAAGVKK